MERVDLLIDHAAQVATCAPVGHGGDPLRGGPLRGSALNDAGVLVDGAVAVDGDRIVAVGPGADLRSRFVASETIDATGKVICPGLVDCHTHTLFAGSRVDEWERKLQGVPYLEILAAGGGILNTVRATRAAGLETLVAEGRRRLARMRAHGSTTVEIKSGYGLDAATELRLLAAMQQLALEQPARIVPTLLAAHATPPECAGDSDAYIGQIVDVLLPAAAAWYADSPFAVGGTPFFNDIFVEAKAFGVEHARRLLTAGTACGMIPKLHVDQFNALGGTSLAVALGAASADHLDATPDAEIELLAASPTVAVLLPATIFHTGATRYPRARAFIEAGAAVALATDLNPGSAPVYALPFVMALACRHMGMSPAEALNACTINAAHALRMGHRIGSLEPGKQADLLLLDCDDLRALPYWMGESLVEAVWIGGARVLPH
jgi:imidazolonepropionase